MRSDIFSLSSNSRSHFHIPTEVEKKCDFLNICRMVMKISFKIAAIKKRKVTIGK